MISAARAARNLALVGLVLWPGLARSDPRDSAHEATGLAIVDFSYVDTSGETADQTAAHAERLRAFMATLRRDFAATGHFRLAAAACGSRPCAVDDQASELVRATTHAGVRLLIVGGIHKMSTLVQWVKVQVIDREADRVILDKVFTFRGDTDEAWRRAESFVSRDIAAALPARSARD